MGISASCSPICTPARVPASVRSLKWPRWPIRKVLPASLPRPAPSDMSKRSKMISRTLSALYPSDSNTAVTDLAGVAGEHSRQAFVIEHRQRLAQPIQQVGDRCVREEPVPIGRQDRLPVPVRLRQTGAGRGIERLFADGVEAAP